ncbi:hypothetical protein TNIN_182891 [Trichonephila inaurata madagascariensis]|uniref:Uncharacterized protein n=1 Tax=Trichonephila inaurata madagascariensis TaxID=2747483 RepID=A0A8X7CAL0_9ARAC|nr:hypothetical protein TNIN_182891 [Trichonephila inaurata madagascariensis]
MTTSGFAHIATIYQVAEVLGSNYVWEHYEKGATRTLNILQLNINGTQRKRDELQDILMKHDIQTACLQKTELNENLQFNIKGYTILLVINARFRLNTNYEKTQYHLLKNFTL